MILPYAYGTIIHTIRVWLYHMRMAVPYAYTRMVRTIRVWYKIRVWYRTVTRANIMYHAMVAILYTCMVTEVSIVVIACRIDVSEQKEQ